MQTVWMISFFITVAVLVMITSMVPRRSVLSAFELERRRKAGDETAANELKREMLLDDILSLKRVAESFLLVLIVVLAVAAFPPIISIIFALIVALFYGHLAHYEVVHEWANRIYEHYDEKLVSFVDKYPQIGRVMRTIPLSRNETEISSREELEHLVENAGEILTDDEKKLLTNGLHFPERHVEAIMTPRGVIETIPKQELVGPLMLDALHKTGHSRFPVVDGDIDHVVGVLHIKELLNLKDKDSKTAAQAMDSHVYYINQDQTLDRALAAFIKTRRHLFIVVNGYRETAGIITLEDVMEALLGREIVDEYDIHDDLRVVAERNAKGNNNPPGATNL